MNNMKYQWLMIRRPHLYYPEIMCNGFILVPILTHSNDLEIEKKERSTDTLEARHMMIQTSD
jgi:hypothetical protein